MHKKGSEFRRGLIKDILTKDIEDVKREIVVEVLPSNVSVIHLPSSTLQYWKSSYLWVKFLALLIVLMAATGFFSTLEYSLRHSPLASSIWLFVFAIGGVITFIIDRGERVLGIWRYECVGRVGLLPVFHWRYICKE